MTITNHDLRDLLLELQAGSQEIAHRIALLEKRLVHLEDRVDAAEASR